MRSLEQWLAHQERAHPHPIDLGLARLKRVLERLRWRQPNAPVITVAGTNGKGSVVAYCAAMLKAGGYRVGTFTSPHLRDYRERIRINDAEVAGDALIHAFERIEAACTDPAHEPVSLTFFEYNALAALLIFEAQPLDAWVLEIGMGGRLDAVNVVEPSVAVVVSIGLDHQEFLGPTLESIAREKAGIFRPRVPAVLGSREMPPALTGMAREIGAPLKRPGLEYEFSRRGARWHYRGPRWNLSDLPPPALLGDAQFGNAAAAIAALEELAPRLPLAASAVARGIGAVRLPGRFQVIAAASRPTWILDVAHNPDAARVLADNLRARPIAGRTLAVCGILADKDAAAVAEQLRDCIDEWWLCPTEGVRGTSSAALAARIGPAAVRRHQADDIGAACAAASAAAGPQDRIVVFGSFHTVGPAMNWLEAHAALSPPDLREYTAPPNDHE